MSYGDSYVGWDAENPPPPQKKQRSLSLSKVWEAAKSVFSGEKS